MTGKRADGTHYELTGLDVDTGSDAGIEAYRSVMRQCRPGAVVTYPDGSRYKVPWKPGRFYTCPDSGMLWRVMTLRKLSDYCLICPDCGRLVSPYETEDYTEYAGYPAVHGCYDHCGKVWTHLHEMAAPRAA